jgi:Bacterial lipid A biosynthesis acyltransferase
VVSKSIRVMLVNTIDDAGLCSTSGRSTSAITTHWFSYLSDQLALGIEACLKSAMRRRWKQIRYRLEWLGLFLASKLIPFCSRRVCYHIAQSAGALLSFIDRRRYEVALNNLEVAFGDTLSPETRRKIARESFQHFARTMVDLLWSPRLTKENFSRYIELENFEETARGTGPERSRTGATRARDHAAL